MHERHMRIKPLKCVSNPSLCLQPRLGPFLTRMTLNRMLWNISLCCLTVL